MSKTRILPPTNGRRSNRNGKTHLQWTESNTPGCTYRVVRQNGRQPQNQNDGEVFLSIIPILIDTPPGAGESWHYAVFAQKDSVFSKPLFFPSAPPEPPLTKPESTPVDAPSMPPPGGNAPKDTDVLEDADAGEPIGTAGFGKNCIDVPLPKDPDVPAVVPSRVPERTAPNPEPELDRVHDPFLRLMRAGAFELSRAAEPSRPADAESAIPTTETPANSNDETHPKKMLAEVVQPMPAAASNPVPELRKDDSAGFAAALPDGGIRRLIVRSTENGLLLECDWPDNAVAIRVSCEEAAASPGPLADWNWRKLVTRSEYQTVQGWFVPQCQRQDAWYKVEAGFGSLDAPRFSQGATTYHGLRIPVRYRLSTPKGLLGKLSKNKRAELILTVSERVELPPLVLMGKSGAKPWSCSDPLAETLLHIPARTVVDSAMIPLAGMRLAPDVRIRLFVQQREMENRYLLVNECGNAY